ncbi:ABC transporter substrate-binding protein [Solimicrobium silvestre]|uniref:ABC-type branched-chain amino acid transport systems periplasmic component n=1 Tax=Solimicrobium silvestre TaxID=2099400 RepID=A0A2S9GT73_9BURK|nr:ABC transporter substrate-binding protein [Solimicrobium silvestre]PRC90922.1 ABC-type branched-chain amino acid transport systems periplasmic component [Solimicrobium silvestre]
MRKYKLRIVWILVTMLFGVAQAEELPTIKIGIVAPVTGKSSEDMGTSIVGGAKVFLEDINQIGGILGRKVELVIRDDQAKPDRGVAVSKELVDVEKVVAVVGFGNSGVALPSSKIMQDAKIPLIISGATAAAITQSFMPPAYPTSYVFRVAPSDALQPIVMLNDLIDRRKINNIALIHDESPYGILGKRSVLEELARRKIKAVDVESFKTGDQDLTVQLQRAKDSGAQAIVMYCLHVDAAVIVKTAQKLHMNVPIVGPWTISHQTFSDNLGSSAEGVRTTVTFIENELNFRTNEFATAYKRINKVSRIPSAMAAAQTYDALRLLTLAIYKANSTDGTKIQAALENLDNRTTSTVISRYFKPFSPLDHEAISLNMILMGEIHNGKVVYAYKEDANENLIVRTKK